MPPRWTAAVVAILLGCSKLTGPSSLRDSPLALRSHSKEWTISVVDFRDPDWDGEANSNRLDEWKANPIVTTHEDWDRLWAVTHDGDSEAPAIAFGTHFVWAIITNAASGSGWDYHFGIDDDGTLSMRGGTFFICPPVGEVDTARFYVLPREDVASIKVGDKTIPFD